MLRSADMLFMTAKVRKVIALTSILSALCISSLAQNKQVSPAEVVFRNGNIYTVDPTCPRAEAVAISKGRFIYVGTNKSLKPYIGPKTKIVDLAGKTAVPGLTDSHYHLTGVGLREMTLNLEGSSSLSEMLSRVSERVKQTAKGAWVTGRGWIEKEWKPQRYPTRQDLDKIAPDNPVWLVRADGHGGVANSSALKIAGVTKDSANPSGGEIMKDPSTGEPTGMLSDGAMGLVDRHVPATTAAEQDKAVLVGADASTKYGWTQVQVAGGSWGDVERLRKLYQSGKLKLRVYQAIYGQGFDWTKLLAGAIIGEFDHRLTARGFKIVFDGALGSKGAALLEPYHDHNSSGFFTANEAAVKKVLIAALKAGIQVETHAIGDRANRTVLNLYEEAFIEVPASQRRVAEPRWRIEHAQIVHPDEIPRFAKLGIIPSMQPSHAIGDLHFAASRLGMERLSRGYAWQSFLHAGCIIAGGSDAPVERGDPMIEFYAAVSRRDLKGFQGEGWHPEQAVDRMTALKMFTIWAAYAAFEENLRGSIEVGKLADMTVLSADIMKMPVAQIPKAKAVMTIIGGEIVYGKL